MQEFQDNEEVSTEEAYYNQIIERVLSGDHMKRELICNKYEEDAAYQAYKSIKRLKKSFKKTAESAKHQYIKSIKVGESCGDEELYNSLCFFEACYEFFVKEFEIINHSLDEFTRYLLKGHHIIDTYILGWDRPEDEMFDYIEAGI